jgi:hypothetical protein
MTKKITASFSMTETGKDSTALNRHELTSVYALLAYVAYQQSVEETVVREIVATHFNVPDVTQLPQKSYDEVVRFLVDMKAELLLN